VDKSTVKDVDPEELHELLLTESLMDFLPQKTTFYINLARGAFVINRGLHEVLSTNPMKMKPLFQTCLHPPRGYAGLGDLCVRMFKRIATLSVKGDNTAWRHEDEEIVSSTKKRVC